MGKIFSVAEQSSAPVASLHTKPANSYLANQAPRLVEFAGIPIPAPRPRVLAEMADLAENIAGPDAQPIFFGECTVLSGYLLHHAGLIILGTACRRPLLLEEARAVQEASGHDILVVRLEDDFPGPATFTYDFLPSSTGVWLPNLARTRCNREAVLLGSAFGQPPSIHLTSRGSRRSDATVPVDRDWHTPGCHTIERSLESRDR